MSSESLEVDLSTPDNEAPIWPLGSTIVVDRIESTAVEVHWPTADDAVDGLVYEVFADGIKLGTVDAPLQSFRLEGLSPAQMVLVRVGAKDGAGNESVRLGVSVETPDGGPPTWADTTLNWQSGLNHATFNWAAAQDDVAVTGYRVVVDGELKFETTETSALLEGLVAGKPYAVRIDARDAASNWSANGPSAQVTTVERAYEGFRRLSKLEYIQAVAHLWLSVFGTEEVPSLYCDVDYPDTRAGYCKWANRTFENWVAQLIGERGPWYNGGLVGAYPEEKPLRGEHELGGGFRRIDQRLFDEHVGVWAFVAGTLTQYYVDLTDTRETGEPPWGSPVSAASLAQLRRCEDHFGRPEDDERGLLAYTRTCFESFMEIFGSRAMRRMLTDDERAQFMGYFDAIPEEMSEALESDRQKLCWINVHYRPRNPTPSPWIWNTGDEDFAHKSTQTNSTQFILHVSIWRKP